MLPIKGEKAAAAIPCHDVRQKKQVIDQQQTVTKAGAENVKSTVEWFAKNLIFICVFWKTEIVSSGSTHNPKRYLYQFCTTQTIRLQKM